MAEANASDDRRQLLAHLESLRRAGLSDLPRVEITGGFLEFEHSVAVPHPPDVPVEPPGETEAVRAAEPIDRREASAESVPKPIESPRSATSPGAQIAPPLPGMKDVKPAATEKRPQPPPARKPVTTPITAFFDQSRVRFESPAVPMESRPELLRVLADEVAACTKCPHLAATRTQTVFQSGTPSSRLMFIGEAPGADEDRLGEPFVGRAGQLLSDIVSKGMGLSRSEIYIANVLKCRPPENRNPLPDENANCRGYLDRQIEIVRPEFICLLGKVAVGVILETSLPMKNLRLRWHRYRDIPTIVTWHPAYLLYNPAAKKDTWDDIKMLMAEMGLKPPKTASD